MRFHVQVGRMLLDSCIFIHLSRDEDKFLLLLEMLHKLYAVVNLQCCEGNPDTLTHHEIMLPGQLLAKFFKEKVEDVVREIAEQVQRLV
jgi:DNA-directed RNA polymerase I subunit RPA2